MRTFTTWYERDAERPDEDQVEIEVEFELELELELEGGSEASGLSGPPEDYEPGSAPEVVIGKCFRVDTGADVTLSDAEADAVVEEILGRLGDFTDDGED